MSTPPPPRDGHAAVRVVDVWAHNEEEELLRIRALAIDFRIAAVAVSHDGPPALPCTPDLEARYEAVRASVDGARSAEVGLALASHRDGALALGGRVWRFHVGSGPREADPRRVCEGVRAHCRAVMCNSMLVTSDGAEAVAYLVRHVNGGGPLPRRRAEFLREAGAHFQALFDLRVLAEWTHLEGLPPPLAGSATAGAFCRFVALARDSGFWEVSIGYNAFLYGLGAADTDQLVGFKKTEAKYKESLRRAKERLIRVHGEAYVNKINPIQLLLHTSPPLNRKEY